MPPQQLDGPRQLLPICAAGMSASAFFGSCPAGAVDRSDPAWQARRQHLISSLAGACCRLPLENENRHWYGGFRLGGEKEEERRFQLLFPA